jgi:trehalose-phosphatase
MAEEVPPNKDLRKNWDKLRERIDASARLCILSDFDGTLVALESSPDLPRLKGEVRRVLEALSRSPRAVVGIVSGRSLEDLLQRVDLPGIWVVGNHGFEIRNPHGIVRRLYEPEDVRYVAAVREEMARELQGIPGVLLEHKGPILAVHHRAVEASRVPEVEREFMRVMGRHRSRLMVSAGHAVLEARLRGEANKGRAVTQIRYEQLAGTLVLYFGDDLTDRDAFRELRGVGVSVEVGGEESSIADFTLPDPKAVLETLARIRSHLETNRTGQARTQSASGRKRG